MGKPAKKVNKVLVFHAPHDINLAPKPGIEPGAFRLPLHVKSPLHYGEVIKPAFGNTPQPSAWGKPS